uniref:Uncharacterized protein n=1 Tax=Rhizophora mucronata TaxID=61149 RepID=A0A2P2R3R3_RHIMU
MKGQNYNTFNVLKCLDILIIAFGSVQCMGSMCIIKHKA